MDTLSATVLHCEEECSAFNISTPNVSDNTIDAHINQHRLAKWHWVRIGSAADLLVSLTLTDCVSAQQLCIDCAEL